MPNALKIHTRLASLRIPEKMKNILSEAAAARICSATMFFMLPEVK
jgi:hypothetical protein